MMFSRPYSGAKLTIQNLPTLELSAKAHPAADETSLHKMGVSRPRWYQWLDLFDILIALQKLWTPRAKSEQEIRSPRRSTESGSGIRRQTWNPKWSSYQRDLQQLSAPITAWQIGIRLLNSKLEILLHHQMSEWELMLPISWIASASCMRFCWIDLWQYT